MSLYNLCHGVNESAAILLAYIELNKEDFGRFRDAYLIVGENDNVEIVIHTRCGGGNRDDYSEVFEKMEAHPLYLYDSDSDFDCTYCDFFFNVREKHQTAFKNLMQCTDNKTPQEKWEDLIKALEGKRE